MPKILIIEDDRFLRDLVGQKAKEEGYEVLVAATGEEGVKTAKEERPSLVLLDIVLSGMDGFEVLGQLKAKEETKDIPVIVLSNLGQKEDVEKAMQLGATDYLVKAHFTPGEIIEKVRKTARP